MNSEPLKQAAENALLLVFARISQVVLVPLMLAMLAWGGHTINNLQVELVRIQGDVGKAIAVSEGNNRLLIRVTDDIERRITRIENKYGN